MATELANQMHRCIEQARDPFIKRLHQPDTPMPWPGQSRVLWPKADISGELNTGEIFIVEIDDHADPARSLVKYWPLIHAIQREEFEFPPIHFLEISSPDKTFGAGFQLLAQFIGERFEEQYPNQFRFSYVNLQGKSPQELAKAVIEFVKSSGAGWRKENRGPDLLQ